MESSIAYMPPKRQSERPVPHQIVQKIKVFELNPAQKAAAHAPISPLLIVAGAGTGKTRTLTSRIIHLIEKGVPPERICAITFTNKAAREMANRVAGHWPKISHDGVPGNKTSGGREPFIGTFHSLGARVLRKECRLVGRQPNFVIFDDHDSFDLLKKIIKGFLTSLTMGKNKKMAPAFFAQKISKIKNAEWVRENLSGRREEQNGEQNGERSEEQGGEQKQNREQSKEPSGELNKEGALVSAIFQKYEEALARNNAFDFDDLIEKPVEIFKARPTILEKHRMMFDALLVDEYQDINPKQYELVKLLAGEHKNLSVVGDDEQTIYSWRYADIKTFLGFDKDWPHAKIYFLEENYRSTGNIIRAAAAVAANNRYRTPKKLWTQNPEGDLITLFEAWGDDDEAEWIAEAIAAGRGTDTPPSATSPSATQRTAAILYRTNAQSRAIEQALIRRDIPYQIFGGLKFYERREVKDVVAALRWAANDRDALARERLEKNLSKKNFERFGEGVAAVKAAKAVKVTKAAETATDNAIDDATDDLKPLTVIKIFLETFGYFDYLEEYFINAAEREENIGELIRFASSFEDLNELLERLSLLQATDDVRETLGGKAGSGGRAGKSGAGKNEMGKSGVEKKVVLTTIHMAKGLEFDWVFVAGAAEGLLPHIRSIDNEESLEEERRLMYVAMTRAKEKLHVSFYGMPSRFIGEIPEKFLALFNPKREEGEERVITLD